MPARLVDREPRVPADRLIAELVPPPRFDDVRLKTYLPDPTQPSQRAALEAVHSFHGRLHAPARRSWFRRRSESIGGRTGLYLDGGFGVGKTHLLASLWHAAPDPKVFGTFVEITNLVGALGFQPALDALSGVRLLCIDEFELDDPGDTVLVSTLLSRLVERGVGLAATSNTLPDRLGEGRFAAADFLREIQSLAAHFEVIRIDGDDYRHRGWPEPPAPYPDEIVTTLAMQHHTGATLDDFDGLLQHLARVHPSRYGPLLDGVDAVFLRGLRTLTDQSMALRLVVFADRLYDRDIPVVASGAPLDEIFAAEMLAGGYRKKYHRAVSRLVALARQGAALSATV